MWDEYFSPKSVREVLEILQSYRGQARIIAGGTDLIPEIKGQIRKVKCLVDISEIDLLKKIERDGDTIKIGAGITHSEVASSELVREQAMVLAEAASAVGSPLIRNQGTVMGNVVNAQPAADTAVALFALEAKIEIISKRATRIVPIEKLYKGVGLSKIDSTIEIATAVYFKSLKNNQGSAFVRLAQRKALALPILNVAAVVTAQNDRFSEARVVVAPVAPRPLRSKKAEAILTDAPISPEYINMAAEAVAFEAQPRDSALRGSAEYRMEMVKVLLVRALRLAIQRVKEK
jgi:CO/xanthine dehydrogenase FAD-binding subunit